MFSEEFYKKKVPILGPILKWMGSNGMDYGPLVTILGFILIGISFFMLAVSPGQVFSVFFILTPIWLPILLFILFFNKWTDTVGGKFYLSQGRTTLRVILPQEVLKSPEAMEFVISQIHNTANPDNLMQTYLDGKRPLPFSFEIVSIGGEVRLYINVPTKKTRNAVEAALYSQYPGVEVVEEPVDYAAEIPLDFDKHGYEMMAFHVGKKRDQEMPIKTYIDYNLHTSPKEEEKLDPMTPMLEVLASAQPHERIFVQIICVPFRKDSFSNGQLMRGEGDDWTDGVKKKINEIMNRDPKTRMPLGGLEDDDDGNKNVALTMGERDTVAAMERNSSKYAYNTAIRWLYITREGKFNGDIISPVIRSFSQYDMIGRNEVGVRWRTDFDYKDLIPGGKRKALDNLKKQELKEYRMRIYYPKGKADGYKIFTAEELATMFHLPGAVALTPTLKRVGSARGEAPANLPTGDSESI